MISPTAICTHARTHPRPPARTHARMHARTRARARTVAFSPFPLSISPSLFLSLSLAPSLSSPSLLCLCFSLSLSPSLSLSGLTGPRTARRSRRLGIAARARRPLPRRRAHEGYCRAGRCNTRSTYCRAIAGQGAAMHGARIAGLLQGMALQYTEHVLQGYCRAEHRNTRNTSPPNPRGPGSTARAGVLELPRAPRAAPARDGAGEGGPGSLSPRQDRKHRNARLR